jgi:hypothetical protein
MSKVTKVYSALIEKLSGIYLDKTRLHNPYALDENPDIVRKNSWGLKVDSASRQDIEFCNLSIERNYTIILMRQFVSLASKEDGFDSATIGIIEDQQKALTLLNSPDNLGQNSLIDIINIAEISGIQELIAGEKRYLFGEVTFNILISELIN